MSVVSLGSGTSLLTGITPRTGIGAWNAPKLNFGPQDRHILHDGRPVLLRNEAGILEASRDRPHAIMQNGSL